jgi:tetratricopeptide (TPR) repeat protein
MDNHDEALTIIRRALTIQEQSFGERSHDTRTLMIQLSDCLCYLGNLGEAESLLTRAHEIESAVLPNDDFRFCYSANVLAKLLSRKGEHDRAIHNAREACALISKVERPLQFAEMQVDLCQIIHNSGRRFDLELLKNAVSVLENASPHMGTKGRTLLESVS